MMRRIGAFLVALLLAAPALAGSVTASLSRTTVALGETVTLNIEADGMASMSDPNFNVLTPDFVILNRNSQQNFSSINGKLTRSHIWAAALQPRRAGTLTIPSFTIGGKHTKPITLTVTPAAASGPHGDVFIEYSAEPARAWVGQQVLLRVRLFYRGNIARGNLDEPKSDSADIRKFGNDLRYSAQRNGASYHVIERRYTLFATKPGAIDLPALGFQGQLQTNGFNGFGNFFGGGRVVTAASPPLEIKVDPPPSHGSGDWLPAHDLSLTLSGLPADGKATVGEPLTLTLSVTAKGLPFETLPEPSLPAIAGAKVYPDKTANTTTTGSRWLIGSRVRKFALVPQRAGTLQLPPVTLTWWNTETGKLETAKVPAHSLSVTAAAGTAVTPSPTLVAPAPAASSTASAPVATAPVARKGTVVGGAKPASARGWRIAAIGFAALWVLTLLAWLWRSRTRPTPEASPAPTSVSPRVAELRRAFRESGDAATLSRTLLAWARAERPDCHNLGAVAAALDDADQRAAIAALERGRFGAGATIDIAATVAAFRRGFAWRKTDGEPTAAAGLPPLYPSAKTGTGERR